MDIGPIDTAPLPGIHHVTAITADGQRNVDFYTGVLGLRLVKQTVNFDVPDTYHLYYGDRVGTPGSAMTFFAWPHLRPGTQGAGQVTVVAFAVPRGSLDQWAERLGGLNVLTSRADRFGDQVLSLADADGMAVELVASASNARWAPWPDGPVPVEHAIRGFHSVTLRESDPRNTVALLTATMDMRLVAENGSRQRLETGGGGPGTIVEVLAAAGEPPVSEATGTVHHVAFRAHDDGHQLAWRARLVEAGQTVTPMIDRKYFHSIYFREPGGVLFEIATDGPGFLVDEDEETLGQSLQLPVQLEATRKALRLPALHVPERF